MIETLERAGKIHLQQLIAYVESIGFKFNRDEGNWKIYGNAEDKYVVLPGWEAINKPDYSHRIQDACHRLAVLHPDMMSVSEIIKEVERVGDWDKPEVLQPLDIQDEFDAYLAEGDYNAYLVEGGQLEYSEWLKWVNARAAIPGSTPDTHDAYLATSNRSKGEIDDG